MIKADTYIEHLDALRQPDRSGRMEFQCDRAPVIDVAFRMARGQVLAVNYSEIDQGVVKATFDAHALVHAVVWYVPRGAKKRKG